jgi:molybdate transport system substrate-binding protein
MNIEDWVKKSIFMGMVWLAIVGGSSMRGAFAKAELVVFCGSAVTPPLEEAGRSYQQEKGIQIIIHSGGSGTVLSQMRIARQGDLYIPGSPDFMLKALKYQAVYPETIEQLAYLIPVISVPKGNPKQIASLNDLVKPGLRIAIANPESVCVGLYAIEILEYNGLLARIRPNIITQAASCELTASLVVLGSVDAVLGWDIFGKWRPDRIETVYLDPSQLPRIAYIPAAISRFTKDRDKAEAFLRYLASEKGREIFSRFGYRVTESEARIYAPRAQLGGEYSLPDNW